MALLFMDSFDYYGNGQDVVTLGKWGTQNGAAAGIVSNTIARTGTYSYRFDNSNGWLITKPFTTSGGWTTTVIASIEAGMKVTV